MKEMLNEERYWIFWDDKVYNSGIGHWEESKKEVEAILKNGFYDGEGNKVEDYIITDYNLNIIYKKGSQIRIDNTVLPNIKLVGDCRYVDLESKGAADFSEEAVLMSILKENEWYDRYYIEVYTEGENGEEEQVPNGEIVERIKKLKEVIIQKYIPHYVEMEQFTDDEDYDLLLEEVLDLICRCHSRELKIDDAILPDIKLHI